MSKMRIGIDLLWVRPGKNGGTESFIRNLLDGFISSDIEETIVLFVSEDNCQTFEKYRGDNCEIVVCPIKTNNFAKRVIWENVNARKLGKRHEIDRWFFPVYSRPFLIGKIPSVTVIHDMQAIHYPEYFSKFRNLYFRLAWSLDCLISSEIVTLSEFCKSDIETASRIKPKKITVIYNPVDGEMRNAPFSTLSEKYGIVEGEYYYTVSSLAKHKNLITLLKALKILKDNGSRAKLVISGVKVNAENDVFSFIKDNDLEESVVYTGFISNEDRNSLYHNCKAFVFPSVFEGFGMPPIEAIINKKPVLTTKEASIYEVTEGLVDYVQNPYDEEEWAKKMASKLKIVSNKNVKRLKDKYNSKIITKKYIDIIINAK